MKHIIKYCLLLIIAFAINSAYAGDPIPGIDISLKNTKTNKTLRTKTDKNGKYKFKNLKPGTYTITVSSKGKSFTFGTKKKDQIVITSGSKKGGDDLILRKRPGRTKYGNITLSRALSDVIMDEYGTGGGGSGGTVRTKGAGLNSSRSNRTVSQKQGDDDSDGDGLSDDDGTRSQGKANHNTTRSNRSTSKSGISPRKRKLSVEQMIKSTPKLTITINNNDLFGHISLKK